MRDLQRSRSKRTGGGFAGKTPADVPIPGAVEVIVVGAGAAGMMAAASAARAGARVLLLEKTDGPGKKILVSGKTRCNLTNARNMEEFIPVYGAGGTFLYRAFHRFFRDDLLALLQRYGVETREEAGGRIFPVSGHASDVVAAFRRELQEADVKTRLRAGVTALDIAGGRVRGVRTAEESCAAEAVVLATGGATYPGTGSTGDGYRMAGEAGHTIVPLRPALVPLVVGDIALAKSLQGTSLRNVRLTAFRCPAAAIDPAWMPAYTGEGKTVRGPCIASRQGEMMFTHFGIGGPITLQMSLAIVDALAAGAVSAAVDLKPALTAAQLEARLQRDLDRWGKRSYRSILEGLVPRRMALPLAVLALIEPDKPAHQITADERRRTVNLLKVLRFDIRRPLPLSRAMVTAGGVSLREIDPRTMGSRLVAGLFFCGEVMDIDADTGGFNLQAAFSTGVLAGEEAAKYAVRRAERKEEDRALPAPPRPSRNDAAMHGHTRGDTTGKEGP